MSSAISEFNTSKQKWWKSFTKNLIIESQNTTTAKIKTKTYNDTYSIFGLPLEESLQLASVAISMIGPDQKPYIYGFIPVLVAKCGLYLKEQAIQTEGIFRISGSTKRIQQLQNIFSIPPIYGKDLNWYNNLHRPPMSNSNESELQSSSSLKPYFSVHDAANLLRRYLMCLPEPLINQSMYEDLRQVLSKYSHDKSRQIRLFKSLISTLNPSTQYLLLYLLDLLAVFANRSNKNLMTANNLAVIFQPALCPANPTTQDKLNRIIYAQQHTPNNQQIRHQENKSKNHKNLELQLEPSLPSIQQESLLEQESIMKHVKQAQAVVEFLILNQHHFVIRPSLHGNLNDSNVYDSSNHDWSITEGDQHSRVNNEGLVSTPRPSSCHSIIQKPSQQQQQRHDHSELTPDSRHFQPTNLKRSRTLPGHHVKHINGVKPHPHNLSHTTNQPIASPLPPPNEHSSPPQYVTNNSQPVTDT